MSTAEAVKQLKEHYSDAILDVIEFYGETTVNVRKEGLKDILNTLKKNGYLVLMDLTGVDYIFPKSVTKIVYWLHNPETFQRIRITLFAERNEKIPSVTNIWEGADWYERELYDMFGVHFEGHPDLKRILMPDDWKGHPLQKDYALTEEPVEFKHGVLPKVPSEIITYVERNNRL